MLKVLALLLLLVLSLSLKYVRYSSPLPDENEVAVKIEHKLSAMGWSLERTLAMNTNMTSNLMVFRKNECQRPLYMSLSGSDASNIAIFKQFMGHDEVVYLLSDFSPERYVYLRFYVQYVYNMVRAVLGAGAAHYSPLLLVYNPDDHDGCNLLKSLQQHQQTMDIVL